MTVRTRTIDVIVLLQVLEEAETKAVTTVGKKRIRLVEDILNKKPRNYTWGSLDIDEFIQKITQEGITDAKVESCQWLHHSFGNKIITL